MIKERKKVKLNFYDYEFRRDIYERCLLLLVVDCSWSRHWSFCRRNGGEIKIFTTIGLIFVSFLQENDQKIFDGLGKSTRDDGKV